MFMNTPAKIAVEQLKFLLFVFRRFRFRILVRRLDNIFEGSDAFPQSPHANYGTVGLT